MKYIDAVKLIAEIERRLKDYWELSFHNVKAFNEDSNVRELKELRSIISSLQQEQDMGEVSDGYHTFNELYYYRMLYNAAFFNLLPKEWVHKSKRHHTGEECFGGGWFIVMANLPTGQVSNHYELKDWDLFKVPEKEFANEWDGHTPQEAAERIKNYLQQEQLKFRIGDMVISKNNPHLTYKILATNIPNNLGKTDYQVEIFTDGKSGLLNKPHNIHFISSEKIEEWGELVQQEKPEGLDEVARIMADECLQGLPINGEVIPALKDIIKIAVHYGAEWDRTQMTKKVDVELENAFQVYSDNHPYESRHNLFKAGAEWKKQQMLKDVVEGKLDCDDCGAWVELKKDIVSPCEAGDKVKLIILKEDESK